MAGDEHIEIHGFGFVVIEIGIDKELVSTLLCQHYDVFELGTVGGESADVNLGQRAVGPLNPNPSVVVLNN